MRSGFGADVRGADGAAEAFFAVGSFSTRDVEDDLTDGLAVAVVADSVASHAQAAHSG